MIREFALDPDLLSNWKDFKHFTEKFGVSKGRLISRYPKDWAGLVRDAARRADCPPIEKHKIVEKLLKLQDRILARHNEWGPGRPWLQNAEIEHGTRPFQAIIAQANPRDRDFVLCGDDLEETTDRFVAHTSAVVPRTPEAMAAHVGQLLRCSREVVFVDPYFDPGIRRFLRPLRAFLLEVRKRSSGSSTLEAIYHTESAATPEHFQRECDHRLVPLLPDGVALKFLRWEKDTLHNRYVLTERGGYQFGTGLDDALEFESCKEDVVTLLDDGAFLPLWRQFGTPFQEQPGLRVVRVSRDRGAGSS